MTSGVCEKWMEVAVITVNLTEVPAPAPADPTEEPVKVPKCCIRLAVFFYTIKYTTETRNIQTTQCVYKHGEIYWHFMFQVLKQNMRPFYQFQIYFILKIMISSKQFDSVQFANDLIKIGIICYMLNFNS